MVPQAQVTGGRLVVEVLEQLGVEFIFGVPGGQTLAIMDALIDSRIRFVTTRHENAAAGMADAVGRLTGRPGVCMATTGPGATNLITAVGGAYRDSSPVLVLTCNNRLEHLYRDDAQAADHVALFRPLTKWATMATTTSTIPQAVSEAYLRACSGRPGPVLLDCTRDSVESSIDRALVQNEAGAGLRLASYDQRPAGDPLAVRQACNLLLAAERPVVWLGNGAKLSKGGEVALQLAERLQMPIVTTYSGIGVVPGDHPLVFGPLSRMGTEVSSRAVQEADLLLAVGNSLDGTSTGRWTMPLPPQLIQVDLVAEQIGASYEDRTFGVVGDARQVLEQFVRLVDEDPDRVTRARLGREAWLRELDGTRSAWWRQVNDLSASSRTTVRPDHLIGVARRVFSEDAVVIADAGNPGVWSFLWPIPAAGEYLKPVGFGNMGFGLPAAIAASLQYPGRQVLALVGDGSLGMTVGELETLRREGAECCLVIMDDSGYGNIRQEQEFKYGARPLGVEFQPTDYATVAEAYGIKAIRVEDPGGLESALIAARDYAGPVLVEVPIDPTVSVWTYPPFRRWEPEE